ARRLLVSEGLDGVDATDHEQEGDETARHVQTVEAGREVEHRAVRVGLHADVLGDQLPILEDLTDHEDRAEGVAQEEPLDDAPLGQGEEPARAARLQAFCREHAELGGERRRHQDERVDEGVDDVELRRLLLPQGLRRRTEREVHREQAGEEHDLAAQPDDRADRDGVGPVDDRSARCDGGGSGHSSIMADIAHGESTTLACRATRPDAAPRRVATIVAMPTELTWPAVLTELLAGGDLSISEAEWTMAQVMSGEATPAQIGAFLVALRAKGETVDEIVGFRDAILAAARPLPIDPMALDIVGTGGDRFGTVNVSSMSSIVCAAAGVPVAKHG